MPMQTNLFFSIDLASVFGFENVQLKQLDTEFIRDFDLNDLMDQVSTNESQNLQNPSAPASLTDDT